MRSYLTRHVRSYADNLWHTEHDARIPGRGVPLEESRTYNALAAAGASSAPGRFGIGWSDAYGAHLQIDASGNVTLTQADGSTLPFQAQSGGTFLASPLSTAHLSLNAAGTYTLTYHDKTQALFDSTGRLTGQRDRNGYLTTLTYAGGNLATVTDPAGRQLVFAYNADGTVSSLTDPAGHVTRYTYDGSGNLASTTDAAGDVWAYTYDAAHALLTLTDPNGGVTTNTYDTHHRVTRQVDPAGRATTWEYAGSLDYGAGPAGQTLVTDPLGRSTLYNFNAAGAVLSRTDAYGTPDATTWTFGYDSAMGNLTTQTDPAGHVAQYTWDGRGNLLTRTDPDTHTTTWTYTARNDVATETDPTGVTTTRSYDSRGNLVSISTPSGTPDGAATTLIAHADSAHPGDVTSVTDPTGRTIAYGHDQAGNLISSTDAAGDTTTWTYDADGQQTSQTTPRGNATGANAPLFTTTYTRDPLGRITKIEAPEGAVTRLGYDPIGNLTSRTDPNQHTTHWTYDADNELTITTRPDGSTLRTTWDAAGQRIAAIDGNNNATTYGYDMLGREISITDPLGRTTHNGWDTSGRLVTVTDDLGRVTTYGYDPAGMRTSVDYSDPATSDATYRYDADGRMTYIEDNIGPSSWTYDNLGRMTESVNRNSADLKFTYDLAGRLTSLTYPDSRFSTKEYDAVGRMASVSDGGGHTTTFGYDADSNLTQIGYADGSTGNRTYDHADALTSIVDTHPGITGTSTWLNLPYTRTAGGQIATQNTTPTPAPGAASATTVTPETLARDGNDRITGATAGPQNALSLESYGYNPGDDIVSRLDNVGTNGTAVTTTLNYDAAHQLSHTANSVYTEDFTYDRLGQRTGSTITAGGQQFTTRLQYDQAGRLTQYQGVPLTTTNHTLAQTLGGNPNLALSMVYDGLGRRTDLAYSTAEGPIPLVVYDTLHDFITGPGGMILETTVVHTGSLTGTAIVHHTDQLGSTRLTADTNGNLLTSYTYDAYGRATTTTLSHTSGVDATVLTTPIGYAGGLSDTPTGLLYLLNRYYDPYTGQFLTRDPALDVTGQPYTYTLDDPVDRTDPLGLCWGPTCWSESTWTKIGLVVGGIALAATGVGLAADVGLLGVTAETAGLVSASASYTATTTGAIATFIDGYQCIRGISTPACFGAITGAAGGYYGLASMSGTGAIANFINAHALAYGGLSYFWDLLLTMTTPSACEPPVAG